jgi:hypothetical protein
MMYGTAQLNPNIGVAPFIVKPSSAEMTRLWVFTCTELAYRNDYCSQDTSRPGAVGAINVNIYLSIMVQQMHLYTIKH